MLDREILKYSLDSLLKVGAEKSQCVLRKSKKYELNIEGENISLLRTVFDTSLSLTGIKDNRKGTTSLNKVDQQSIDEGVNAVMELCETSQPDEAYDIAPIQEAQEFFKGDSEPDLDKMYDFLKKFKEMADKAYPRANTFQVILTFEYVERYFVNSNGADFKESKGSYEFSCVFAAREGEKTSSFNYTDFSLRKLEKDLLDCGTIAILLKQSEEQLDTKSLEGKFVGDVVITPDCLSSIIAFYLDTYLSDRAIISGTSSLKDKLNEQVANSKLTLHSNPASEEITAGYFVTADGFKAENVTLIEKGILNSFLLTLYGAKKTGLERAKNNAGGHIIEAGDKSFEEIVKRVDRGILLTRYSGGNPSSNGDFSGVAKNSYYIENGEIKYPISETMISGNLYDLLMNIKDISRERIDFGSAILPWLCSSGVTISGK
jgi:PmbA protein